LMNIDYRQLPKPHDFLSACRSATILEEVVRRVLRSRISGSYPGRARTPC